MAQTLAAWEHGVVLLDPSSAPNFFPPAKGRFRERISLGTALPWTRVPLAIEESSPGVTRVLRLVVRRVPSAWGLQKHACWQQHRHLLPEAPSRHAPTLCWGYAMATHRKPLWYLWPSHDQVGLWHHKGLLYARVEHPDQVSVVPCWRSQDREPVCQFRTLPAHACFEEWKAAPLEEEDDDVLQVPDETVPGRMDLLVASTIAAMEAQSPDYCARAGCLSACAQWRPAPYDAHSLAYGLAVSVLDVPVLAQ